MKGPSNRVFVAGATGYTGSHTCVELLASGQDVSVFDNLSSSNRKVLNRLERITGSMNSTRIPCAGTLGTSKSKSPTDMKVKRYG
jgi:UDP-glucose 4-epimerase